MTVPQALSVAGVCERDLDLLLLEELTSSVAFCRWFVSRAVSWPSQFRSLRSVRRSVTRSSGESDLELTVQLESGTVARLLIENKIDAAFQPDQSDRYRLRSRASIGQGECAECATVLVAPARYFGADDELKGFDGRITYEDIRTWFEQSDLG
jgi:hypothetical protein